MQELGKTCLRKTAYATYVWPKEKYGERWADRSHIIKNCVQHVREVPVNCEEHIVAWKMIHSFIGRGLV